MEFSPQGHFATYVANIPDFRHTENSPLGLFATWTFCHIYGMSDQIANHSYSTYLTNWISKPVG